MIHVLNDNGHICAIQLSRRVSLDLWDTYIFMCELITNVIMAIHGTNDTDMKCQSI
jgi:hypothetical protein